MYKVIKLFADLEDKNHVYYPGDIYPREGAEVNEERIKELSGSENKRGEPLIELIEDVPAEDEKPEAPEEPEEKPKKKGAKNTTGK